MNDLRCRSFLFSLIIWPGRRNGRSGRSWRGGFLTRFKLLARRLGFRMRLAICLAFVNSFTSAGSRLRKRRLSLPGLSGTCRWRWRFWRSRRSSRSSGGSRHRWLRRRSRFGWLGRFLAIHYANVFCGSASGVCRSNFIVAIFLQWNACSVIARVHHGCCVAITFGVNGLACYLSAILSD